MPSETVDTGVVTDPWQTGYSVAAAFIAEAEWFASLGLPKLPDDPAAAAAMRAAGYDVLAECTEVTGAVAVVSVAGEDEEVTHAVAARALAEELHVDPAQLAGTEFLATMRETPEEGPVLSGFRPLPAGSPRHVTVQCLLLFGDQAELTLDSGGEQGDVVRWPASAITGDTDLELSDLPGRRFRARVLEADGRVLFSAFTLLP
jgi:hypothetical protein